MSGAGMGMRREVDDEDEGEDDEEDEEDDVSEGIDDTDDVDVRRARADDTAAEGGGVGGCFAWGLGVADETGSYEGADPSEVERVGRTSRG